MEKHLQGVQYVQHAKNLHMDLKNVLFVGNYYKGGIKMKIEITNKQLAWIEANKSMGFECPNCKHTQITKAWNYTHKYCPHCGAEITWDIN